MTPKRKPRVRAGAARFPSHPPAAHTAPGESRKTPVLQPSSGTFNPGAPGRAFCSPRAAPRAPRRFRTPLPSRFHGNHTNMLISVLQPSRPQLIAGPASPADKSQSKVYSLHTPFLSVSLRLPGRREGGKEPEPRGGSGFLGSEGRRGQIALFRPEFGTVKDARGREGHGGAAASGRCASRASALNAHQRKVVIHRQQKNQSPFFGSFASFHLTQLS